MKRRAIYKYISYLLLVAMVYASVPFHQLCHTHVDSGKVTATLQLKKFEKPCCQVFDGITGDINTYQHTYASSPDFGEIDFSIVSLYFSSPFSHFTNKAPPVAIA